MTAIEHNVVELGDERVDRRVTTSRFVFSPGQIIAGILGLVMAVIGAITMSRAGVDSTLNQPIVHVAGLDQSAMVGAIELGLGLLLVLGSLSVAARGLIVFVGVIMVIGGVVVGSAGPRILHDLGTVQHTGWMVMVGGIIAIAAGCLGYVVHTRRSISG